MIEAAFGLSLLLLFTVAVLWWKILGLKMALEQHRTWLHFHAQYINRLRREVGLPQSCDLSEDWSSNF